MHSFLWTGKGRVRNRYFRFRNQNDSHSLTAQTRRMLIRVVGVQDSEHLTLHKPRQQQKHRRHYNRFPYQLHIVVVGGKPAVRGEVHQKQRARFNVR